jgi:hypothetical protein
MEQALTGLGLYVRPGAAPTSIAVNLGLRAAGPSAERPWACRISTALQRPGPDGLAHNVAEIERLAVLGRAIVKHLSAVFAAAVTTGGTRTWLLYASGADEATAAAAAEVATSRAFADHPGYAPTTTVSRDVAWEEYGALYPTAVEAGDLLRRRAESDAVATARAATQATVRSLRSAGVDLTRPAAVRYTVTFPTWTDEHPFAPVAAAAGLRAAPPSKGVSPCWVRDDLPDLALILRTERWLIHEAGRCGGQYGGWTTGG